MVRQSQGRIFAAFPGPGRCAPPKIRLLSYFPNSKEKPKNRTIYRGKETRVARMINEPARISPWALSGLRHKYDDVRCAQFGLWRGARRAHPRSAGCNRRATKPQAEFGATRRAA